MFDRLEDVIQGEMQRGQVPGLAIALVKGSEISWSRGFGVADVESKTPMTPETVFSVQSVTKPVVATALMQRYERGDFRLDDPANRYLAPARIQNEYEETDPVTIRQLLTHTSGLPVDVGAAPPSAGQKTLEEFVALVAKTVRPPGQEIIYANWGYDIIGLLVQRFSGKPWDECVRQAILKPLGMAATAADSPPEGLPVARGHFLSAVDEQVHTLTAGPPALTTPPSSAGELLSTVEDLGRFLIAHLNGGALNGQRILRAETVAQMHRLHAPAGRSQAGMGLGFRVARSNERYLICHGGDGLGFTNFIGGYPEEKVGIALTLNRGGAQTARSVIANTALATLTGSRATDATRRGSAEQVQRLAGRYGSTYWDIKADITIEGGQAWLTVTGGLVVSAEHPKSSLFQGGDGVFLARGGMFDGFELTFDVGTDPSVVSFYGGVYPLRFDRQGDVVPVAELARDEAAELVGSWSGTAATPLGPMLVRLEIVDATRGTVDTPFAQKVAIQEFAAEAGRVSGQFVVTAPGIGEMQLFLRLQAAGGKLQGPVYTRGWFGEVPMATELSRG